MINREFYQLPELADRWSCSIGDLLRLGAQDELQICVNIYGMASGLTRTRICTEDDVESQSEEDKLEATQMDAAFEAWHNRTTQNMPYGVFELDTDAIRFIEMPDGLPFDLFEARKFDNGWWYVEFDPPVTIKIEHLCMLHEEVVRLDSIDLEKLHLEAVSNEAASALISQVESLHQKFCVFAENGNFDTDYAKLLRIGNWQRIVMLDRSEEGEEYLSRADISLLRECGAGYILENDQTNLEWQNASVSERLVAFGHHVYAKVISGQASTRESLFLFGLASEIAGLIDFGYPDHGREYTLTTLGRLAANIRHSRPGGSREKRQQIREIWKSGKYSSRDICAEQECAALGMSFSAARKALRNTPDPH